MSPEKRKQMMHCMKWRDRDRENREVLVERGTYSILLKCGNASVRVVGDTIEDADYALVSLGVLL